MVTSRFLEAKALSSLAPEWIRTKIAFGREPNRNRISSTILIYTKCSTNSYRVEK